MLSTLLPGSVALNESMGKAPSLSGAKAKRSSRVDVAEAKESAIVPSGNAKVSFPEGRSEEDLVKFAINGELPFTPDGRKCFL